MSAVRAQLRRAHTLSTGFVTVAMMIDFKLSVYKQTNIKQTIENGLSVSAIRSRYQTTLRCFPTMREVLSRQGAREDKSLSGGYTGAERK